MADTLKNLKYMQITGKEKYGIGLDKVSHFPDMNIQDDSTLYAKLLAKKRSTFDRNKFAIGSQNIVTNEGIAGNFGKQGVITTSLSTKFTYSNLKGKSWSIEGHSNLQELNSAYCDLLKFDNSSYMLASYFQGYTNIQMNLRIGTSEEHIDSGEKTLRFTTKRIDEIFYKLEFIYELGGYKVYVKEKEQDAWTLLKFGTEDVYIPSSTNKELYAINVEPNSSFRLGYYYWGNPNFMDLKYTAITVDGIEVFNGNKTGIDQIKKDDYFLVQDSTHIPQVSENGILTLPSGGWFSTREFKQEILDDFSFITSVIVKETPTVSLDVIQHLSFNAVNGLRIRVGADLSIYGQWANRVKDATTSDDIIAWGGLGLTINLNTKYYFKAEKKGTTYTISYRTDNTPWTILKTGTYTKNLYVHLVKYGTNSMSDINTWCEWDLNDTKVFIGDQLYYQPTLRIPYTQSKTDEKIVDAVYRDRVQDMYEQFGYTHYYTIGDEPEKYNVDVVGNPTLVGGIASGFSNNNYIYILKPLNIDLNSKTFTIKAKFDNYQKDALIIPLGIRGLVTSSGSNVRLVFNQNNSINVWGLSNNLSIPYSLQGGDSIEIEIIFTPTLVTLKATVNGEELSPDLKPQTFVTYDFNRVILGATDGLPYNGSIDLSQTTIEVDEKEVLRGYEPAILDAFTLATNKNCDVIDSYYSTDGVTSYELTADLQQTVTGGGMSGQTVTLAKPFKDGKYICTKGTSAKTATTLTLSENGTFIAKGLGVLG